MDTTHAVPDRRAVAWPLRLFQRRTWAEVLYALIALPLGIAGFVIALTTLIVGLGLSVTLVGLPVLAASMVVCRALGDARRRLANRWVQADVPASPPTPRRGDGWVRTAITDRSAWRARLYLLLSLPVGIAGFVVTVTMLAYGLGGLTYWIWRPFLPCQRDDDGTCHRAAAFGPHYFLDTPGRIGLLAGMSAVVLLLAPFPIRAVVATDKALMRRLLGPSRARQA